MAGGGTQPYAYQSPESPPPTSFINWNLMEANNEGDLSMSADDRAVAFIAGTILDRFNLPSSDDEFDERSDADDSQSETEPEVVDVPEPGVHDSSAEVPPPKRTRTQDEIASNRYWFPWPDRITCTLDILMHLPRSVFSQKQLDLFLWLLKVNHVEDVPSIKQMQKINLALQKICGIETIAYNGALGHKYFVNSLAQIIAQEMANPRVRPHLSFFPEDSGPKLSEARQGQRWLTELPNEQTTPMLHISGEDYFIYEPAMLDSEGGEFCIPVRWFVRGGEFFAKYWKMVVVSGDIGSGWRVLQSDDYEVSAHQFLKNFIQFQADAGLYNLPDPSRIIDFLELNTNKTMPWTYTNPVVGNRWRAKANGSRVVSFPMWLYCDDTSGNVSKKWNEHNSFLMTPAGLPREEAQKEYNIHFLCTSNLARPLEMLDGIVEQLEDAQREGIWAWDIELDEPVLVIPEVLALLGDNPMQSEFACHIGLRGKLFCRACWVKGHDAMDGDDADKPVRETNSKRRSEGGSVAGSDGENSVAGSSDEGSVAGNDAMVDRVRNFMTIGKVREKEETTVKLRSFFTEASTKLDTKTKVKDMRTETGLKDKFQMVFIDKLFNSYKKKRGPETKCAALDAMLASLPQNTMSPVWRIKGLDPHQDTPVEILHVVLLGFVKYLWRDLIQQLKGKDDKKELLTIRLSSLDVSGLDFRAIAQVAPFVVYDLVSKECFETWQALSKIIPLVWQPEIVDVESHLALLTREIDHFLLCAAKWTNRWFNKPKFHIFLHLPAHIRRFGPAILFATEAFESFNAIIRAKSVHSNRHAPSRDIAHAFAQGNRVRHLLSGGVFILSAPNNNISPDNLEPSPTQPTSYTKKAPAAGVCVADKSAPRVITQTLTGKHIPSWSTKLGLFKTNEHLYLHNGDSCMPRSYIIAKNPHRPGETFVARVEEIIHRVGSVAALALEPEGVLLQKATLDHTRERYGMPSVQLSGQWSIHSTQELLCTVNVQHNCLDNHCGATTSIPVFQERIQTTQTQARVAHTQNIDDVVLNTAQMRDAVFVQRFRLNSPRVNEDEFDALIHQTAAKEIDARKIHASATSKTQPPRPQSRTPVPSSSLHLSPLPPRISGLQNLYFPG
ncbi:hypothetical protein B0H19DRAFT_1257049 [Mycena capillaripes]|nr:hypothetical protein B0H19DRAFT_1257049 [Mycena capillaripes]